MITRQQNIGYITLNRPQVLNALNLEQFILIQAQLDEWQADDTLHAVVITGTGRAFCAGGDIRWVYEHRDSFAEQVNFFQHEYRLNYALHNYPKPCIALMHGITFGGGVGLALHCSHTIASENFLFAMPETSIGFFPDIGSSHLLTRLSAPNQQLSLSIGKYLGLTGARIGAADACALNLVKYYVPEVDFAKLLQQLLLTDLSVDAHNRVYVCIENFALPVATGELVKVYNKIQHSFAQDSIIDIINTLAMDAEEWSVNIKNTLLQKSPFSLWVTLLQLQRAVGLSLAECLQMDYNLVQHFLRSHDFYE